MPEQPNPADQYDLGDTSADPALDSPVTSEAPPVAPAADGGVATPPQRPTPPRGEGGRFVRPEDAPPTHSRQTLRLARDLGISDEEIAATPPDMLDDVVYHAHRHQLRLNREYTQQQALTGATAPPVQPAPAQPAPLAEGFDEEDYDPGLMGVIKALKARIDQMEGFHRNQAERTVTEECDQFFAANEATFGKGRYHEIRQDSPEMIRRSAVISLARTLNGPTVATRLAKAHALLYGATPGEPPQPSATKAPATTPEAEEWRRGGLARPTHRGPTAEAPGPQKAMKTAARILKEAGGGDNGTDDNDGFLG